MVAALPRVDLPCLFTGVTLCETGDLTTVFPLVDFITFLGVGVEGSGDEISLDFLFRVVLGVCGLLVFFTGLAAATTGFPRVALPCFFTGVTVSGIRDNIFEAVLLLRGDLEAFSGVGATGDEISLVLLPFVVLGVFAVLGDFDALIGVVNFLLFVLVFNGETSFATATKVVEI